ncbi:hypothetical protein GCM10011414_07300 [Croceivirga lutea]|uniref:hypothetical protein n=1 Tax=Croceivirga lutea TaxID=1775167 RepID=UPI0016398E10|nr:hypothetical protein [Croceivirga lutea]GGG40339.1 hypothetical protein GCM10011414_07300 [Croceivirga lutea]
MTINFTPFFQVHTQKYVCATVLFFCVGFGCTKAKGQNPVYTLENNKVKIEQLANVNATLSFQQKDDALQGGLVNPIIEAGLVSLVRFLPKLLYNPTKFVYEDQAKFNFFKNANDINYIDENLELVFTIEGDNATSAVELSSFVFEFGNYEKHEGYYYMGLKSYDLQASLSKLKPKNATVNIVLEVLFDYYDENNTKKEFVLNPFYINNAAPDAKELIRNIDYQLLPKMEILQSVTVKITEVNSKKETWDKWLGLYEKHQGKLPAIFR